MFKGKVWPALLCNAASSLPPWTPQTARHIVLAPTTAKAWSCWRKNRTANHSKAKPQLSHSLAHREAWRCSLKAVRKWCWESYGKAQQLRKDAPRQSQGHCSSHQRSLPRFGSPVERMSSTLDKRRSQRVWTFARTLLTSPRVLLPQLTNCD